MPLNCFSNATKNLPAALLLLLAGLLVLSCGVTWQHAFAPLLNLSTGPKDFLNGFCIGLGLTLEIVALVMLVRISRQHSKA